MKDISKRFIKKSLRTTEKVIIAVPILRKAAVKAKSTLLANLKTNRQEIYDYHIYYPSITEYVDQKKAAKSLPARPLISILMPTFNTPEMYLRECIDSVLLQSYDNWELCIADDASSDKTVVTIIQEYAAEEPRIKYVIRKKNGHISEATNSALALATGEYVALLDHDDVLWPNALYEMVASIIEHPEADLIYTDEDKIGSTGSAHSYPFLKPDWSPEFLESCNYITHFTAIKASVLREIGGPRKGYEGAQDWDLFVRITERTQNILHIPKILYSWRIHEASTASNTDAKPYVYEAQLKLLSDHLERTKRQGRIETGIIRQHRTIKYASDPNTRLNIFIIVHSYNATKRLLQSLLKHTEFKSLSVIYLMNEPNSSEAKNIMGIAPNINQQATAASPSDWAAIVKLADADYLAVIDDDVEIISDEWAEIALGDLQLPGVSMVGPVLVKPDKETIESAGVGVGYGQGYADMLQGVLFEDPHYTRGLYAKSRRNVSALHPAVVFCKKATLKDVSKSSVMPKNTVELSLAFLALGYRQVYTPYIKAVYHGASCDYLGVPYSGGEDAFLNPHFNHADGRMEVI